MCLIIHVKKGVDKQDKFIEEAIRKAAEFNKDGMGYILKREDNSLFINKGFFDVNSFLKAIKKEKVNLNDELTIHLRIGNKGETNTNMCHPFVISKDPEEIDGFIKGRTDKPVLMHNGTMYRYSIANSKKSDTYFFTKNVMSNEPVLNFLKADSDLFNHIMQPHLCSSRLAVVFPDETESILIGNWFEINGLFFSKDYHEEYFPKKIIEIPFNNFKRDQDYYDKLYNEYDDYYDTYNDTQDTLKYLTGEADVVDIPRLSESRQSFVNQFGIKYELYMGLYLPRQDDFNDFIVEVNSGNYKDAHLTVLKSDYRLGIITHYNYKIEEIGLFTITVSSNDFGRYDIKIPKEEFYEFFSVRFKGNIFDYYREMFKLVKSITVSKSLYKKLNKAINNSIEKNKDDVVLHHNNIRYEIDILLASDFLYQTGQELKLQENPALLLF